MSKINNSFGLLRTNPKLSSNYKLTVSSDGIVSIRAIVANPTLADIKYSGIDLTAKNTFGIAINRLYDAGSLKPSIAFDVRNKANDQILQKDFQYQFEDQYMCGLSRTRSKIYKEEFAYFAPLYIKQDIPKYFVIFRVPGAANIEQSIPQTNLTIGLQYRVLSANGQGFAYNGPNKVGDLGTFIAVTNDFSVTGDAQVFLDDPNYIYNYIQDPKNFTKFLSDAEIVKTFDLSPSSDMGSILRSITADKQFTPYPIEVDFENAQITYHGINIKSGVLTQVVEHFQEIMDTEMSITEFDQYVTQGFERNGLVNVNCVNIEFLFNDNVATDYKFYRYFGLYLDALPIGKFLTDTTMYQHGATTSLYPFLECLPINYAQTFTDPDGIKIKPDLKSLNGVLFEPPLLAKPSIFYIKGVDGLLHKVDNMTSQQFNDYTYGLKEKSVDIRSIYGFEDFTQVSSHPLTTAGRSSNILTVESEFAYGEYIDFWDGKRLVLRLIPDDLADWNANAYPDYIDGTYEAGRGLGPYFFLTGTNNQIAAAIAEAFNASMPKIYNIVATPVNNQVYFITKVSGIGNNQLRIETTRPTFSKFFVGGTPTAKSRVRIQFDITKTVDANTYVKSLNGFCKVASIAPYIEEPVLAPNGKIDHFANAEAYAILCIDSDTEKINVLHGQSVLAELSRLEFGVFSFYPFKDFDFDFVKSDYSKSPTQEYKKYFNVEQLEVGYTYRIFTRPDSTRPAQIKHNGVTYNAGQDFVAANDSYTIVAGIPVIIDRQYLYDEELQQFIGFNTLNGQQGLSTQASSSINPDQLQNKTYLFATTVKNEYEYLREDANPALLMLSRTLPTITKWVSYNGTDVRGNKYRLNLSRAFGELGFSPSFFDHTQNPKYFTHEWPYLVGTPKNISLKDLLESGGSYFSLPFNRARLSAVTQDYFSSYFTVDYVVFEKGVTFEAIQIPRDVRYTEITKLLNGSLTTFFRGVQVNFVARKSGTDITRLAGYKYSTILQVKRSTFLKTEPQIDLEIVENKLYKNITFIITLICNDYKVAPGENPANGVYPDYISLYATQSLKQFGDGVAVTYSPSQNITTYATDNGYSDGLLHGYVYGLKYAFPDFFIFNLYNSPPLSSPPVVSFRAFQAPSTINYKDYGGPPNIIKFDALYDVSSYIKPVAKWDNVNHIPSIAGPFGRLITMDEKKFTAITAQSIYYDSTHLLFDTPNTVVALNPASDVVLQSAGMAIINNPGQVSNSNYDPLDIHNNLHNLSDMTWFYENGGVGAYALAMNLISFASIQEDVNIVEKYVHYTTIDENGIEAVGADFKVNMIAPSSISRTETLTLQNNKVVLTGLPSPAVDVYTSEPAPQNYTLHRFGGQFEPKTRDVLLFQDDYIDMKWDLSKDTWANASYNWLRSQLAAIKQTWGLTKGKWVDTPTAWNALIVNKETINQGTIPFSDLLIGENTKFNLMPGFAISENVGVHRVNESGATVFKTPVLTYPQVDEIAISTRSLNVFNSNWEHGYFTETIDKFNNILTYGTRSIQETKAALGGKALTIPDIIQYSSFSYAAGIVDPKLAQTTQSTDIIYTLGAQTLQFYIDLTPKFVNTVFLNSKDEFYKYLTRFNVSTTSIDDSILAYINSNIVPVFEIGSIQVYTKASKDKGVTLQLFVDGNNAIELLGQGYTLNRTVGYTTISDLQGIFSMNVPDSSQISVALVIELAKL